MKKIISIIFVGLVSIFIATSFFVAPPKAAAATNSVGDLKLNQDIYNQEVKTDACSVKAGDFWSLGQIFANFNGADSSKGLDSVKCFVIEIISILLNWAGIVAVAFVLYGSFLYVTSYGDDQKIELAKKTLTWAIIGIVIITFSGLIVNFIASTLYQLK